MTFAGRGVLRIAQESPQRCKARHGILCFDPVDFRNARGAGNV